MKYLSYAGRSRVHNTPMLAAPQRVDSAVWAVLMLRHIKLSESCGKRRADCIETIVQTEITANETNTYRE